MTIAKMAMLRFDKASNKMCAVPDNFPSYYA